MSTIAAPPSRDQVVTACRDAACTPLFCGEAPYPPRLAEVRSAPPVLYARGRLELLEAVGVAVVGTRRAGGYGLRCADELAAGLARAGVSVISGMARGVDAGAHAAALRAGGATIAVLGCGVDVCYPPESGSLKARIEGDGLVLSQFPPGTPPLAGHFPARNRVISGLAHAVVVVQAGLPSGAMITAEYALDQERPLFAMPGPVFDAGFAGNLRLLAEGTALVARGAEDVLREIGLAPVPAPAAAARAALESLDDASRQVLQVMAAAGPYVGAAGHEPLEVEEIIRASGMPSSAVIRALTRLELEGLVRRAPGNRYTVSSHVISGEEPA